MDHMTATRLALHIAAEVGINSATTDEELAEMETRGVLIEFGARTERLDIAQLRGVREFVRDSDELATRD
jgi:hypothetical protein